MAPVVGVVLVWVAVMGFMAACGDDNGGNEDTIWTGLSGVVIAVLIIWGLFRLAKSRRG